MYPEVELLDCMVILFKFWRNPCTVFHILHSQEFTCTQVSVPLHSHQHWLFSGGCFVLEGVYVCVRGLNNSHPDGHDVVSHCGFDLFHFVTAHSLLCCFRLHRASLPGFFTCSCVSPTRAPQQCVFSLGTSIGLPLHLTFFSPPFTQEQMKPAPVFQYG